jgi:hypothetical protein
MDCIVREGMEIEPLIWSLKKLSGNDTRSTGLHGHTQPVAPPLSLLALYSLGSISITLPLTRSYTCSGKPLATCCLIKTPWLLVPMQTLPTERPVTYRQNLVPTFADRGVSRGQHSRFSMVVNLTFLDRSCYFSLSSQGWVDPAPDPLLLRKFDIAGIRTQDLWVSSQELWLLDHRGSLSLLSDLHMISTQFTSFSIHHSYSLFSHPLFSC